MSLNEIRPCPCGSGKPSHWLKDAKGIPCCRVCGVCSEAKQKKYRPEIFTKQNYFADEPIEP